MKKTVLFLCATNGVQSPMAEALLNRIDSQNFEATSAAVVAAGEMHPLTINVMNEVGINLEQKAPTPLNDLRHRKFDFVITLGDKAKDNSPTFPDAELAHWLVEDPMSAEPEKQKRAFELVRDQIAQRLN